jgi:hypothetical protein
LAVGVTECWFVAIYTPTYGKTHVESGESEWWRTGVVEDWSGGVMEWWSGGVGGEAPERPENLIKA